MRQARRPGIRPQARSLSKASLVLLLLIIVALFAPTQANGVTAQEAPSISLEQQLVDRYAPIAGLKTQQASCDAKGEPFLPVPVEIWANDPEVVIKQSLAGGSSETDPVLIESPAVADLYGLDRETYLDFPGDPRDPECDYEQWSDSRMDGLVPTTYAHIKSNGLDQLAVQYWFFYVYNDFNNKHEADWEMMQLVWDVATVEEALRTPPVEIALAQHGGGETAGWTDSKVSKVDDHVVFYSAAGSHASQYGSAVYLGWGENGTGFGCDTTTGPTTEVPLTAVLLLDQMPDATSEFSWLAYEGRWGERQRGHYNGPTGPRMKTQWLSPFVWQDSLRDSSIEIPGTSTFGPGPAELFCSISSFGSSLFADLGSRPVAVISFLAVAASALGGLLALSRSTLHAAWAEFRQHWKTFGSIGLFLIPIGLVFNGFQYLVLSLPPGDQLFRLMNENSESGSLAAVVLVGTLQHLVGFSVVGPAIITAFQRSERNEDLSPAKALLESFRLWPTLAGSIALMLLVIIPLSLVVVGIPIAIWLGVRWFFIPQAVLLEDQRGRGALTQSARVVGSGKQWLRVAGIGLLLIVIGTAPGPLVGLVCMIIGSSTVQFANSISSVVYAVFLPFSVLGFTILYRELQPRASAESASANTPLIPVEPLHLPSSATP